MSILTEPGCSLSRLTVTTDGAGRGTQALAFVNVYVTDTWNGLPVNFQSTFLNAVTCADAFGSDPCDPTQLPAFALELWGLPSKIAARRDLRSGV